MHARVKMTNGFSARGRSGALVRRLIGPIWLVLLLCAGPAAGETVHAVAARSSLAQGWFGRWLVAEVALDRPAPFRVFTLDAPPRLVVDVAGLAPEGFDPGAVRRDGVGAALRVGGIGPGWTRLVLPLDRPQALRTAEMRPDGPGARLRIELARVDPAAFAAASGAPPGVWPAGGLSRPTARGAEDVTVAIDPGHGGIDPGAVREGVAEKGLVLAFGRDLRDALAARGFRVLMTREDDDFVALDDRVAAARQAGADVFLSIHLNAEASPAVAGAIAFTRADRGSSPQAAARARAENAVDGLAGLDPGDPVGAVLAGVARVETDARSGLLADDLIAALRPVAAIGAEPRQAANFEVLRAPDMPSVLLELGFLSNPADRAALQSPDWRRGAAAALATGLGDWLARDGELAGRLRR